MSAEAPLSALSDALVDELGYGIGSGAQRHDIGTEDDLPAAEAAGAALDLVAAELDPLAVSLLAVGPEGAVRCCDARAAELAADPRREVANWHEQLAQREPLAPAALAGLDRPVVTFADVGGARSVLLKNGVLLATYRRIGAIDDVRVPIRDGRRLVAAIAVWRPLQSRPWTGEQRRRLETSQPLVEMAYLATRRRRSGPAIGSLLPADLTPRQREVAELLAVGASNLEVARALGISRNTAKSHARAALAKLGAGSRRELMLALRGHPAAP